MAHLEPTELTNRLLEKLIDHVHRHTGITMAKNRKAMLQGRLRRRMRELSLDSYERYVEFLEENPSEVEIFVDLVTTNETYFFRTPRVWDYFFKEYLPAWNKSNPGKILRVWSAASSSGEEAYSIAICCQEFKEAHPGFVYQVLGSDISQGVLEEAANARYSGRAIETFKAARGAWFDKYLRPEGEGFRIIPELHARVRFEKHNLYDHLLGQEPFDIVFLRNVLIYFAQADQEKVLERVRRSMKPDGRLIIGESESLNRLDVGFRYVAPLIYACDGAARGEAR